MRSHTLLAYLVAGACLALRGAPQAAPSRLRLHKAPPQPHVSATLRGLLAANGTHDLPVGGDVWPVGIYWTTVAVGTPPRYFPVAIDSGSSTLDIQGADCDGCVTTPPNNQYDHTKSSTGKPAFPFKFSNTYETCDLSDMTAPCTIAGPMYSDEVSLGKLGPVEVEFGAITSITKNFDQFKHICGVMGFIGSGKGTVFAQLVANNDVDNVWGLCINNEGKASNGTLTIGGVDETLAASPIQWVAYPPSGYYAVPIVSMTLPGATLPVAGLKSSAILDSGTNILLLPTEGFQGLKASLVSLCANAKLAGLCDDNTKPDSGATLFDRKCFPLTPAEVAAYPDINVAVSKDITLTMSAHDYLLTGGPFAKGDPTLYCLGVRATGPGGLFIIGDTLMRNYYMVFDNEKKRTGWAKVNKTTCGDDY